LLIRHPAALRCLRLAVPCIVPCSLPPPGHRCGGPGLLLSRRPHRVSRREHMSPPRFLDDPCVHAPLSDPGGVPKPGPYSLGPTAFRLHNDVGTATQLSRLYHTACTPPVYASQAGSPPHHATLGSGGWPILSGSGLSPAGSLREVSDRLTSCAKSHHPPPPGFAWRSTHTVPGSSRSASSRIRSASASSRPTSTPCSPGPSASSPPSRSRRSFAEPRPTHLLPP
jgi:hypothetical protein